MNVKNKRKKNATESWYQCHIFFNGNKYLIICYLKQHADCSVLLVKTYFLHPKLYGIVVLYDLPIETSWNREYLFGVENALQKFSLDYRIVLQWIRVDWSYENDDHANITNLLHQHIDTGCEVQIIIFRNV